jgi:hypothetical protein
MKRRINMLSVLSLSLLAVLALLLVLIRVYPYAEVFPTFPKITHTASGTAGDPLNVILIGSEPHITQSFAHAGWLIPDPITPQTSARVAADSLTHRPYPTAPVSRLYVFGRVQDLAFEKPTNDVQNRGHIRLWQTSVRIGGLPVWVAQASYDHGIELSGTNGLPTHHIAPTVDLERDAVGTDLATTGMVAAQSLEPFSSPIFVAHNGGGDYYESDGDVRIISYAPAAQAPLPSPRASAGAQVVTALKDGVFRVYDALLTSLLLALAGVAVGLALVVAALWPVVKRTRRRLKRTG